MLFALTGGVACGKSLVSSFMREFGVAVVDADRISHDLTEVGSPVWSKITQTFGKEILHPDRSLNRKELGDRIFSSKEARKQLEAILVPAITVRAGIEIGKRSVDHELVCFEAPTLIENDLHLVFHTVVLVATTPEIQLSRVRGRGFTEEQARARIEAQMPLEEKRKLAQHIIENNSTIQDLRSLTSNLMTRFRMFI